jgi:catechol 2,3-dioxygenase-like lactoylglutathione lyase family enzyme
VQPVTTGSGARRAGWRAAGRASIALLLATVARAATADVAAAATAIVGLDHIPVAVRDLETAGADYRALGFTLKPGRPHADGIRNLHAKFRDGTEIELITAPAATDAATRRYLAFLEAGDGPAYLGFYVPELGAFAARLRAAGESYDDDPAIIRPAQSDAAHYLFFGHRNASPTDRPEHFQHENGADGLIGVWLATDRRDYAERIIVLGGARFEPAWVRAPDRVRARRARLPAGEVTLLPASRQQSPGREVVGAVLRAPRLEQVVAALRRHGAPVPPIVASSEGRSLFVPPARAHGLWLEFRERR